MRVIAIVAKVSDMASGSLVLVYSVFVSATCHFMKLAFSFGDVIHPIHNLIIIRKTCRLLHLSIYKKLAVLFQNTNIQMQILWMHICSFKTRITRTCYMLITVSILKLQVCICRKNCIEGL